MSQQHEQNKTAEKPYFLIGANDAGKLWLFYKPEKTGTGYRCWEPIDEEFKEQFERLQTASQQTASLQKQHREESVKLIRRVREFYQNDIVDLQKQVEELTKERDEIQYHFNSHDYEIELLEKQAEEDKSRITQLEEALKHLLNLPLPEYARREIKQALNPQDNQK